MKPVSPVIEGMEMHEIKIAEHQEEFRTLPAIPADNGNRMISRFELSTEEIEKIIETKSIYFSQWTGGRPMQPVLLEVDAPELSVENRLKKPHAPLKNELDGEGK